MGYLMMRDPEVKSTRGGRSVTAGKGLAGSRAIVSFSIQSLFLGALDLERSGDFAGRGYSLLNESRAEPFYGLTRVR